jgi:hypothetical protein
MEHAEKICPVCNHFGATITKGNDASWTSVECKQCGSFRLSATGIERVASLSTQERAKLSAHIFQVIPGLIDAVKIADAVATTAPTLRRRADNLLRFLAANTRMGDGFSYGDFNARDLPKDFYGDALAGHFAANPLMAVSVSETPDEVQFLLREVLCEQLQFLSIYQKYSYRVSPKGWLQMEGSPNAASTIGFCAMWFANEVNQLYTDVIRPAVLESGYEPLRIDGKEHVNKIDDEIIASIRSARFVVADYTGNRGGVYYEAGFAHGLGLPVFFMARDNESLHFDVRQYNTIFWKPGELGDAKEKLKNRILATIGRGPLKTEE